MWATPSVIHLIWTYWLVRRARKDLRLKNVVVERKKLERVYQQQPALILRIIDNLPLVDWIVTVAPSMEDVFFGFGRMVSNHAERNAGRLDGKLARGVLPIIYVLYIPFHPLFLVVNAVLRIHDLLSHRDEEVAWLTSPMTASAPKFRSLFTLNLDAQANIPIGAAILGLLFALSETLDPFIFRLLFGGALGLLASQILYFNRRLILGSIPIAQDSNPSSAVIPERSNSKLTLQELNTVKVHSHTNINPQIHILAKSIVDAELTEVSGLPVPVDKITAVLKGAPLNLHEGTNFLGPRTSGYMNLSEENVENLAQAVADELKMRGDRQLRNGNVRRALLTLDNKRFSYSQSEKTEGELLKAALGNGHVLVAPPLSSIDDERKAVVRLSKVSKAMGETGKLYLVGVGPLIEKLKQDLQNHGVTRPIEIVPCESAFQDITLDLDQVLFSFNKRHAQQLNSTTLIVPNHNYKISKLAVQSFKDIRIVMLEEIFSGILSGICLNLRYLFDLNVLEKALTNA